MRLVPCELVICDEVPVDGKQPQDSLLVTAELTPDVKQLGSPGPPADAPGNFGTNATIEPLLG